MKWMDGYAAVIAAQYIAVVALEEAGFEVAERRQAVGFEA